MVLKEYILKQSIHTEMKHKINVKWSKFSLNCLQKPSHTQQVTSARVPLFHMSAGVNMSNKTELNVCLLQKYRSCFFAWASDPLSASVCWDTDIFSVSPSSPPIIILYQLAHRRVLVPTLLSAPLVTVGSVAFIQTSHLHTNIWAAMSWQNAFMRH